MPTSNELQAIAQSCLQTIDLVIEIPIAVSPVVPLVEKLAQILPVALRIVVVVLPLPSRAVPGFMGVVFGARDGITDVARTSLGVSTRCPLSGPRLLNC
jgi:hypothetical protein